MTALLVAVYALGYLVSVPTVARWHYDEGSDWFDNRAFCVGLSLFYSLVWPVFVLGWLLVRLCRGLAKVIW